MKKLILNIIHKLAILIRRTLYIAFYVLDGKLLKRKNLITIICYHSIGNNDWRFTVTVENLIKQIRFLDSSGYEFVTLNDIKQYVQGKKDINNPSVAITFDDGYSSLIKVANFFKKQNIVPSLFVLSDRRNPNRKELGNNQSFLTNEEIKYLIKQGWEIGSHTATHSNLTTLSKESLYKEIVDSKNRLEKELGIPILYLAFPRGKYNRATLDIMKQAEYFVGLTMNDEIISRNINLLLLPRVGVDGSHTITEFKGGITPLAISFRKFIKSTMIGDYL